MSKLASWHLTVAASAVNEPDLSLLSAGAGSLWFAWSAEFGRCTSGVRRSFVLR